MGTLLHNCVEMCELIELSFGVVSGVGPGIDVLDGGSREGSFWGCFPHIGPVVSMAYF